MNPLNFNDELLFPADFFILSDDGKTRERILSDRIWEAPIFVWNDLEDDKLISKENDDVFDLIRTQPDALPFPAMRIQVGANNSDAKDGTRGFKAWVEHLNGKLQMRVAMLGPSKSGMMSIIFTGENNSINCYFRNGPVIIPKSSPVLRRLTEQANAIFTSLCWFIRDLTSPANFLATVRPNKQGKSVEWTKARTHYVIVHKQHPANSREVVAGSKVSAGDDYLKRQAHSRRAHSRILRSPRFKNKVGQVIRIKACWVGPAEWKQFGSIYKICQ